MLAINDYLGDFFDALKMPHRAYVDLLAVLANVAAHQSKLATHSPYLDTAHPVDTAQRQLDGGYRWAITH